MPELAKVISRDPLRPRRRPRREMPRRPRFLRVLLNHIDRDRVAGTLPVRFKYDTTRPTPPASE